MPPRLQINDDDLAQVWADGMTVDAIAARMGYPPRSIRDRVKSLGLTPRPSAQARPNPVQPGKVADYCVVPGCGANLYAGSTSKVCRAHNHAKGFCRCPSCGGPPKPTRRIAAPVRASPTDDADETPEILAVLKRLGGGAEAVGYVASRFRLHYTAVKAMAARATG